METLSISIITIGCVIIAYAFLSYQKEVEQIKSDTTLHKAQIWSNAQIQSAKAETMGSTYGFNEPTEGGFIEKTIGSIISSNPEIVTKLLSGLQNKK